MKKGILILGVILAGCVASTSSLSNLSLGMSKPQTKETLGSPTAVRGALTNKYGQRIEVWEYEMFPHGIGTKHPDYYWIYFKNDTLSQWGQAGDWAVESGNIYEVRFR